MSKFPDIIDNKFLLIWFFIVLYNLSFFILSAAGRYPWYFYSRWSIGLNAIFIISLSCLLAIAYKLFKPLLSQAGKYPGINILASLIFIISFISMTAFYAKMHGYNANDSLYPKLKILFAENYKDYNLFVARNATPTVKYLFEYGPLKDKYYSGFYPSHFIFETEYQYNKNIIINTSNINIFVFTQIGPSELTNYLENRINCKVTQITASSPPSYLFKKIN
jgi:hypothetical protein